jgi:enolase-phosphatase E1
MKFILMDVEGTTTSISFVHETLFPYAKEKLPAFLEGQSGNEEVSRLLDTVVETVKEENAEDLPRNKCSKILLKWIEEDRKHPALKSLQGLIWEAGYTDGSLKGHLYADVSNKFLEWSNRGYLLGIYSSGSVKAQKLLFSHSTAGDLTPFLKFHFDTEVGQKREEKSYQNIVDALGGVAENILFLSDIAEELDAAKVSGIKTCQVCRDGEIPNAGHPQVIDFNQVEEYLED